VDHHDELPDRSGSPSAFARIVQCVVLIFADLGIETIPV
jgi:hypothetical protein